MKHIVFLTLLAPALAITQTNSSAAGQTVESRHIFVAGNQSPVAGSTMKVDHLIEVAPNFPLQNEGGIWGSTAYAFAGFSKEVTSSTVPGQGPSGPLVGLFSFVNDNGAKANAVGFVADAVARSTNASVFAANFIARNGSLNGAVLRGIEVDVQPTVGTTISTRGAGAFFNAFNTNMPVPAIQLGGVAGGNWQNGILSSHITGTHFGVATGDPTTASSFIDTTQGSFSRAAIILGSGSSQGIFLGGATYGANPLVYGDGAGNLSINLGAGGLQIKDSMGANQITVTSSGVMTLNAPKVGPALRVNAVPGSPAITASGGVIGLATYTVATLPTCNPANRGLAQVSDQDGTPAYGGALTGGGTSYWVAYCNGSAWTAH